MVFQHATKIQKASNELLQLDSLADKICANVRKELGFDLASLQMIDKSQNIIQTIHGAGCDKSDSEKKWYPIASHSLEVDSDLRDIQADIALSNPFKMEILTGWDNRFDKWIFDKFGHQHITRAFVPIIIVRNRHGEIQCDMFENYSWQSESWGHKGNKRTIIQLNENDLSR